jgi:hypothetical protein
VNVNGYLIPAFRAAKLTGEIELHFGAEKDTEILLVDVALYDLE